MASAHELKTATLGRMTESIAKELNECLCAIVVNSSTCLRMLSANPPNVEGALETARRTIRSSNRAAEAVSRLSTLDYRKEVKLPLFYKMKRLGIGRAADPVGLSSATGHNPPNGDTL